MSAIEGAHGHHGGIANLARQLGNEVRPKSGTGDGAPEPEPTTTGDTPTVQITLSVEAQDFLAEETGNQGPGKSGQSTAHRARAMLDREEFSSLRDVPFGQIVSTLARFGDLSSLLLEDAGDDPAPATVTQSTDPVATEETPDPAPGETSDPPVTPAPDPTVGVSDADVALQLLGLTTDPEDVTL